MISGSRNDLKHWVMLLPPSAASVSERFSECFLHLFFCFIRHIDQALCSDYSDIRKARLSRTLYSAGVIAESKALGSDEPKKRAVENAIPEFMHFNIAESEVRDVV